MSLIDDVPEGSDTCVRILLSVMVPSCCSLMMGGDADLRVGLLVLEEAVDRGGVLYALEYRLLKLGTLKLGAPLEDAGTDGLLDAGNDREVGPETIVDLSTVFDCS